MFLDHGTRANSTLLKCEAVLVEQRCVAWKLARKRKPISLLFLALVGYQLSTYKFKRHFFRHGRRTAPKFGTHVRIETRLALT